MMPSSEATLPHKITWLQCSQFTMIIIKSLLCSTGLLEMPSHREPHKASADETSTHGMSWLAQIFWVNRHSRNEWQQSSSPPVQRMHSIVDFGSIFFLKTRVTSLHVRSSQLSIGTFAGTFCFQRIWHA